MSPPLTNVRRFVNDHPRVIVRLFIIVHLLRLVRIISNDKGTFLLIKFHTDMFKDSHHMIITGGTFIQNEGTNLDQHSKFFVSFTIN